MTDHISLRVNIHQTAECQSVFPLIQGTDPVGQTFRKHRNHTVYQIHAGSTAQCFPVEGTSALHIIGDIRNMHTKMIDISIFCQRNSIIQIFRIFSVNGNNRPVSQIHTSLKIPFDHMIRHAIRLVCYFYRKIHRKFIRSRNRKYVDARCALCSQHFLHSSLRILILSAVGSNLCHNFIAIVRSQRVFSRNKNILLDFLIIRNHKSIVFTFLKRTDYFRDSMSQDLYNHSFPTLTGSFFFYFYLYPVFMKRTHGIVLGNIQIFFLLFQFHKAKSFRMSDKSSF